MGMAIAGSEERGGGLLTYAQVVVAPWLVGGTLSKVRGTASACTQRSSPLRSAPLHRILERLSIGVLVEPL